jgi:hypothetical protein
LRFEIAYFFNLAHAWFDWFQNAGNKDEIPHWQWEAIGDDNETYFMLNTDFEIFFDLDLDGNGKAVCRLGLIL